MSSKRFKTSINTMNGMTDLPGISVSSPAKTATDTVKTTANVLSKWIPLICAGTAVAVSVIAIKEIRNVRKDVMLMKKEQLTLVTNLPNKTLNEKIERMDEQLKRITEYLTNQNKKTSDDVKPEKIIKQAVKKKVEKVNIINSEKDDIDEESSDDEEEVEIEIEVTDDEKE